MNAEYRLSLSALSPETADGKARTVLEKAIKQTGFLPNMYARMANSPGLLDAYLDSYAAFRAGSGFTPAEQEVVFMVISRENGCEYCVAAHSTLADNMSNVPALVTDAIRASRPVPDAKLSALATFVEVMVRTRGLPQRCAVEAFLAAGYAERQILEIVLAISVKVLSNYANHIFHTPVDPMFEPRRWDAVVQPRLARVGQDQFGAAGTYRNLGDHPLGLKRLCCGPFDGHGNRHGFSGSFA